MQKQGNLAIFAVVLAMLMATQFYYWQSRAIPQPAEYGTPPMGEDGLKARIAGGKPFIRFFYTSNCGFSKGMMDVADRLESKYDVERVNAAKYCWSGKKTFDCPDMVPAFVIYRDGEKFTVYGERSYGAIEAAIKNGRASVAGELNG